METSVFRVAEIYVQNKKAGILRETENGYEFSYLQGYRGQPVSLTLPVKEEPYTSQVLFPFFDGLIPEGWLLDIAIHNWKLRRNDRFGLLLICCADCVGDVSVKEINYDV